MYVFTLCTLICNHKQRFVDCKQNNHNGLKPKSWAAEIRSLSYTLSHCRNDIEIWWVCGKVFLLHRMKHERFTLLIYKKKTQHYSPHELSLKTEPRHERRRSNKDIYVSLQSASQWRRIKYCSKRRGQKDGTKENEIYKKAFDKNVEEVLSIYY